MIRALVRTGAAFLWLAMMPAVALAQASIAGVVRDTSGAVLPGVTVEASSPALIEKVRTAVTDGEGRFLIADVRPGTYTVTFSLTGFSSVRREGILLSGTATTNVNADLRVGSLEETITVTGESPLVDTQNTTRQQVMDQEVISALPTARNSFALGVLIPGVTVSTGGLAAQDVGGALGPTTQALAASGGRTEDQRLLMNGVALSSMIGGGWGGGAIPNATGVSEIAIDTTAVDATAATGGVRINFIPRDGGNNFSGTIFGTFATEGMQQDHFRTISTPTTPTQDFRASTIKRNFDFNPGVGGPIKRDKLWFFLSVRRQQADLYVPGFFYNRNANDPTRFLFDRDESQPAETLRSWGVTALRLTWQATERNKFGITADNQVSCFCPDPQSVGATFSNVAPEAYFDRRFPLQRYVQLDWNSPVSSRVLLEASGIHRVERWGGMHLQEGNAGLQANDPRMISVLDSTTGLRYRDAAQFNNSWNNNFHYRGAVSYITGSHALKIGVNNAWGYHDNTSYSNNPLSYDGIGQYDSTGRMTGLTPTRLTLRATPYTQAIEVDADLGLFVQDKWTVGRWTLSGGLRYDYFKQGYPEQTLEPGIFVPNRNLVFEARDNLSWHDITPKMGAVYDITGDGRTALKFSLNKYLRGYGTFAPGTPTSGNNPIGQLTTLASRNWTDNGNFVPDCDLLNPAVQDNRAGGGDLCGAFDISGFGLPNPTTVYDPELLTGWGKREFNWEFSAGVQREIIPRVSVDVSYFRRWYGNFQFTDNTAVSASDFDFFDFTAPSDPRLPGGGGYTVEQIPNIKPASFGRTQNFVTHAKNFGDWSEVFNGIGVNANARLGNGFIVQGGVNTGRVQIDNCEVAAQHPEVLLTLGVWQSLSYCDRDERFRTQVKALASYVIPRIDVQASATLQSLPGPLLAANLTATNAQIQPALGRALSGNAPVYNINILEPGEVFGERLNQLDIRFAKLFRFAGTRTSVNFDIYNALNVDTITFYNQSFGAWQRPLLLLQSRFVKVGAQFDW